MVDFRLDGKNALVTGGSKGIGKAVAIALAENGANVCITARGRESLDSVVAELESKGVKALGVAADITNPDDVDRMVSEAMEAFGGVDILINNAIYVPEKPMTPAENLDRTTALKVLEANVWVPLRLSQLCRDSMVERGGGVILNVASTAGMQGEPQLGFYGVSKAALINQTKQLAKEWGGDSIRVVAIAPGLVRTELTAAPGGLIDYLEKNNLIPGINGVVGEVDEIAATVLLMVGPNGRYFNGSCTVIDGGEIIRGALG